MPTPALHSLACSIPLALILAGSPTAQVQLHAFSPTGTTVAVAGDVDADGTPDVVLGQWNEGLPFIPFTPAVGRISVLSGVTGAVLWERYGTSFDGNLGWSLSGAGDVNGDGYDDVVAGQPTHSILDTGTAFVYSGLDGAILHQWSGDVGGDFFGRSVSGAGDVNADGYDDVVVGADQTLWGLPFSAGPGYARVYSGRDGSELHAFVGDPTDSRFGDEVSTAGDANFDGFDDVIVSAAGSGDVRVYSGFDGSVLHQLSDVDGFGYSIADAGDVNGDWFDDFIVSAPYFDAGGGVDDAGRVRVYSGLDGSVLHTFVGGFDEQLGEGVSTAGDVDGDGFDDVAVRSAPAGVFVFSGATGAPIAAFSPAPGGGTGGIGTTTVDGGADFDGDGFADVVFEQNGAVFAYSAGSTGVPPRHDPHGVSCPGAVGLPSLRWRGAALPGQSLALEIRAVTPTTLATFMIGTPQLVPLDSFGMSGCELYVSPFVTIPGPASGMGHANTVLAVPPGPSAVGLSIEVQGASIEAFGPFPLLVGLTAGLSVTVGA